MTREVRADDTPVQVSNDPPRYERRLRGGAVEVFTLGDRPASHPGRRIFLTEVIDPQGHRVALTYDSACAWCRSPTRLSATVIDFGD